MDEKKLRFALIENLKRELFSNMGILMTKIGEKAVPSHIYAEDAKSYFKGKFTDKSSIPSTDMVGLIVGFMLSCGRMWRLSTYFILESLKSGEFMTYDSSSDKYVFGPTQVALFKLLEEIKRIQNMGESVEMERTRVMSNYSANIRAKEPIITVENSDLINTFAHYNTQVNIIELSRAIVEALEGNNEPLNNLKLLSPSPFDREEDEDKMAKETVLEEDIRKCFRMLPIN